jgi:diguanylate cyclase (GGDEF)-like protein
MQASRFRRHRTNAAETAGGTFVVSAITAAAILLFVYTGSAALTAVIDKLQGLGELDQLLTAALLLNIALVLICWRRCRDLTAEVAERTAAEAQARALASTDELTGLLNRRSLAEHATALLARADRRYSVALMMVDLDHFKTVNDLHGHVAGDTLLRAAAEAIGAALPSDALMARLGGDEFACAFLFDLADPAAPGFIADRIVTRLSQPFEIDGIHAHVSASLGIAAHHRGDEGTIEALMRRADIAMYAAKKAGKNRLAWFDASMERQLAEREALEAGLRAAIRQGEIVPYYEQQIALATGALHGFEVLARWVHPTHGVIAPDLFIPIAEESGQIGELSIAIMRQAFTEARDWAPSLTVSVNISPAQLKDPWLAQKVVKLLVETGFPPERLEIEITERALFENLELARSIILSLKNQGVRLALDDFGTGASSIANLRALPFDRIKVDRSFVLAINDDVENAAMVRAIATLGGSLGVPVTAAGIETAAIEARMRDLKIREGQGWHFGKPMTVAQVRRLLADRALLDTGRGSGDDPARHAL